MLAGTMRPFFRALLALALLWHTAAVTAYALDLPMTLRRATDPYMLLTGQWQRWNMFAPDPETRVARYALEHRVAGMGAWETLETADPARLPGTRRPSSLKLMADLLASLPRTEPVVRRLLDRACTAHGLPPGRPVRFVEWVSSLPDDGAARTAAQWREIGAARTFLPDRSVTSTCPPPA